MFRRAILITAVVLTLIMAGAYGVSKTKWYQRLFLPLKYPETIKTHAANYDLKPELLAAVIYQESRFDESAQSSAGAVGLMQLTPQTARGIAQRTGGKKFHTDDLKDPEINIRYGSWYLAHLHEKLDKRGSGWVHALAAYNAGQGNVTDWLEDDDNGILHADEIPYRETRNYVKEVLKLQNRYEEAWPELQK